MQIECKSLLELPDAASQILKNIYNRKVILLKGEMGAGKTTLISELCKQLGVSDVITSPTFSIVNNYLDINGKPIFHFDFYRLEKEEEAYDLGYEEYLYSGCYCFVEWPEKIKNLLPEKYVSLEVKVKDSDRVITISYE